MKVGLLLRRNAAIWACVLMLLNSFLSVHGVNAWPMLTLVFAVSTHSAAGTNEQLQDRQTPFHPVPADSSCTQQQETSNGKCLPSCIHMTRIFVYGTLKKGQPNYFRMFQSANGKAEFLASACTTQKYPLVIASKWNVPYLLNIPGQGHRVRGEIYEVDDKMLEYLDEFEEVPTRYQRNKVELEVTEWVGETEGEERPAAGNITEAFVYITTTYQPDWPSLPSYENYDSNGDHGLVYVDD